MIDHYAKARGLLDAAALHVGVTRANLLAEAQVEATLAVAVAIDLAFGA